MKTLFVILTLASILILSAAVPGHGQSSGINGWWVIQSQAGADDGTLSILTVTPKGAAMWRSDGFGLRPYPCWQEVKVYDAPPLIGIDTGKVSYLWQRYPEPGIAEGWRNAWTQAAAFPCGATLSGCPGIYKPAAIWCDDLTAISIY